MYKYIKRLIDITLSSALIFLLSPVFIIISALIFFKDGGGVFFLQRRIGRNFKPFTIIKFRTMMPPSHGSEFSNVGSRITPLGRFLRRSSLDELPELLNIFFGQMSFVGPRPLPVHYKNRFGNRFGRRHTVRPGLTGLSQVKGRKLVSWKNKLRYDLFYTLHVSFLLDIYILYTTLRVVVNPSLGDALGEGEMPYYD